MSWTIPLPAPFLLSHVNSVMGPYPPFSPSSLLVSFKYSKTLKSSFGKRHRPKSFYDSVFVSSRRVLNILAKHTFKLIGICLRYFSGLHTQPCQMPPGQLYGEEIVSIADVIRAPRVPGIWLAMAEGGAHFKAARGHWWEMRGTSTGVGLGLSGTSHPKEHSQSVLQADLVFF